MGMDRFFQCELPPSQVLLLEQELAAFLAVVDW
jgi:hypothetical protein